MKFRFLALLIVFIAAGCATTPAENTESTEQTESTDENVESTESAEAEAEFGPATYECKSGTIIKTTPAGEETISLEMGSDTNTLTLAVSASGARYVGDGLVWWTKGSGVGSEGTLFFDDVGNTGDIIESCVQTTIVE
ncbi:MliC family protein [Bradymonas sediminis]|uniref:C-type lysozyme inhibitor domain-containing protein n=1 Tax=Bradymonas sediminis TaxID=1548548 RepID=A0A2Z4FM30_9DELT|nr:MliC family protein [Bradymonas sediminis]AWV89890.1 hypothetical protein DN745_11290 [Bradymonas sediminis]TDP61990.1 membrane-bound lysozyme inhibitor of c-type lysozyme MliC [Bradymonas sediminis]